MTAYTAILPAYNKARRDIKKLKSAAEKYEKACAKFIHEWDTVLAEDFAGTALHEAVKSCKEACKSGRSACLKLTK